MAAINTLQTGLDYLVHIDGTAIGGGRNATLTLNQELIETTNKGSSYWKNSIAGVRSWSVDVDGMFLESSSPVAGSTMNTITYSSVALAGVTDITVDVSSNLTPTVNSTTALDRTLLPGTRSLTCTINGQFYDPIGTTTTSFDDIFDDIDGTGTSAQTLAFSFGGAQAWTFSALPTSVSLEMPHEGVMTYSVTFEATTTVSAPTDTNGDSGLTALLGDWFDGSSGVTSATILLSGDDNSGDTEYTGTAYPESLSVSIPYEGPVTVSGTFQGSGALTQQADAA